MDSLQASFGKGSALPLSGSHIESRPPPVSTTNHLPLSSSFMIKKSGLEPEPFVMNYKPPSFSLVTDAKKQMDDVLDNLKGIVKHVVHREEMKIRQYTNP